LSGKIAKDAGQEEGAYTFTFDKNGNAKMVYKYEFDEDQSSEDDDQSTILRTEVSEEMIGKWEFVGGIDNDYKNKERISFIIESQKTTTKEWEIISSDDEGGATLPHLLSSSTISDSYANGEMSIIYQIVELRNKEIKLHQDINTFHLRSNNSSAEAYQTIGFENITMEPRK